MVAGLRNVHEDLAQHVADGLGLPELPEKAEAAREPITDLPASPALSILANGPDSFAGRKIGVLVADGSDAALIAGLQAAAEQEGATVELVAPAVGGVETSDGKRLEADQNIDGGPSVLYDAVVLLVSAAGASKLAREPAARDFVTDAYAHYKFIGYTGGAAPLLEATGVSELRDGGFIELSGNGGAASFISACRQLRFWDREAAA
jgi:catalase